MKNKRLLEIPLDARDEILRLASVIHEKDKLIEYLDLLLTCCTKNLLLKGRTKKLHFKARRNNIATAQIRRHRHRK